MYAQISRLDEHLAAKATGGDATYRSVVLLPEKSLAAGAREICVDLITGQDQPTNN